MNTEKINRDLNIKGWSIVNARLNDEKLLSLARSLGSIIPDDNGQIMQILRPKGTKEGVKDSFSYNYGYDSFPYHTDTAYWPLPARYVIMKSEQKSTCDTRLIDFNQMFNGITNDELNVLKKSVFIEKTVSGKKFTSFIIYNDGATGIRYDPNIMCPFNEHSKKTVEILNKFIKKREPIQVKWSGENVVVVDNWRVLHSRGNSLNDKNRLLKRIYFN